MTGASLRVAAALEDLRDSVANGRDFPSAISELSNFYQINSDVLQKRASREGGVFENAEKLKRRKIVESAIRKYQGTYWPKTLLQDWIAHECGGVLTQDEITFSHAFYEMIISERQDRNLKIMMGTVAKLDGYDANN